ncbi:NADH-quinone oxidoreductase subunit C [Cutibacterium namnetense]|uniref:Respiratory-chain NADH dehydrogenase, 30 Kd subunit n=2 Tax=Cutibacterium namnetense TaxID=1574624 RepID=F9NX01_9ACTN|nr:NADH-quinone oxidoreductase subunit C [Cutibacterium namnetense]EGR95441.1 respiratory-chain NADH dehydrogenase, 30 Kd subunit [ [[Propionibacterium] namnetense SK182B-JCVI]REB71058.1 NADH-quinone oxidoreductase subunit C [Cutibacterium namnetense]
MTTRDVPATDWHDAVAQAVSTHPWLAHLTAIDGVGERGQDPDIVVVCRLENHDGDDVTVSTRVSRNGGILDSVVDVVAGASWYQREIHDFFGVRFVGPGADDRALLVHDAPKPPLRKEVVLTRRADAVWPGAADWASSKSASRRLAAGVPDPETWRRIKEGEDVSDAEVVAAMSGRRPRPGGGRAAGPTRTASGRRA